MYPQSIGEVSPEPRKILEENYGKGKKSVRVVRKVFREVNSKKKYEDTNVMHVMLDNKDEVLASLTRETKGSKVRSDDGLKDCLFNVGKILCSLNFFVCKTD